MPERAARLISECKNDNDGATPTRSALRPTLPTRGRVFICMSMMISHLRGARHQIPLPLVGRVRGGGLRFSQTFPLWNKLSG
jgi:hypothetical protein